MSTTLDLTGYKLTFDDEFNSFSWYNGTSGTWKTKYQFGGRTLSGNGELEYYSDSSVGVNPFSIENGALRITAAPSTNLTQSEGLPYTSGLITTETSFTQEYGYFEMRAKMPEGQGLWPTFWLLSASKEWPPEIDPVESHGSLPHQIHWGVISVNTATNDWSQSAGDWANVYADITDSYHTYGVMWTPETMTYYFDGQQIAQAATPDDAHRPMYILANLAVGGNWPGAPFPDTEFPAHLDIDYIRAYSNDPNAVAVPMQPVSTPDVPGPTAPAAPHSSAPIASAAAVTEIFNSQTTGTAGNDVLYTNYGDTRTRYGGLGDDTYWVTDQHMAVVEKPGEGVDTIIAWVPYTLPSNIENIVSTPSTYGLYLSGNSLSNFVQGNDGNDWLAGRAGDDVLTGLGGNDVFIVKAGEGYDMITDFTAGSGTSHDQVLLNGYGFPDFASVRAAMTQNGANVILTMDNGETLTFSNTDVNAFTAENFVFTSQSTPGAEPPPPVPQVPPAPAPYELPLSGGYTNSINGSAKANTLYGTAANDLIDGKGKGDTMSGGAGDDTYVVDTSADQIVEKSNEGIDTVRSTSSTYTLAANVENLVLEGKNNHTASGNELNNQIFASNSKDTIHGGAGDDIIHAGKGASILFGDAGKDIFTIHAAGQASTVKDFTIGNDLLDLRPFFSATGYGGTDPLADKHLSLAPAGANGTTIMYDADGAGAAAPAALVTIENIVPSAWRLGADILWH
jgi:beta-glucanase (GH16 family)/Ca2+-binding RTX toxin-like protein